MIEYNPFRDLDYFSKDMYSLLERTPFKFLYGSGPKVDIYQTENQLVLKAELPGVAKEDLNIYVDENSIKLSGQTCKNKEFTEDNVYRTERYYGTFSRTLPLPVEIKPEETHAEYNDGILTITAPKMQTSNTKGRKLDIQ